MKLTTIIALLAIAPIFSSCGKKEEEPTQTSQKAPSKAAQVTQKTPPPTKKSSSPHINAAQQIGEKTKASSDRANKQLENLP